MTITQQEIDDYEYYGTLLSYPLDTNSSSSNNNILSVKNTLLYELEPNTIDKIKFNNVIYDPSNNYNSNNFVYNIPESGYYKYILGNIQGSFYNVHININNSNIMNIGGSKEDIIYLNSNNSLSVEIENNSEETVAVYTYPYLLMYLI